MIEMTKLAKFGHIVRLLILVIIVVFLVFSCIAGLMKIQIVDGAYNTELSRKKYTAIQSVQAARGQISDINGVPLNTNKTVYKVIVQRAFFPYGRENEIIGHTLEILKSNGEEWIDTVPITMTAPFAFTDVPESALDAFKSKLNVNLDATVENCLTALRKDYGIDDEYDDEEARAIGGVRYEMYARDFSFENRYLMCEDISLETVIAIKEQSRYLLGIDIVDEPMRVYLDDSIAPHIRGTIGAISAEEYAELKQQGYGYNDIIGKMGMEYAMESVLRGENGERTIVRNSNGEAVSDEITKSVKTGNSIKLTIDTKFQSDLQEILENHISWISNLDKVYANNVYNKRGLNTEGGSVVVLNPKTGEVLAMANYPSYELNVYVDDYAAVMNAPLNPILNRATTGLYRPGSAFKTITATASLYNGVITQHDTVFCGGVYTHFSGYQPKCTGYHGSYNVFNALKWSCNIFFYDVGRRLGIEKLSEAGTHFGIGTDLGLETGGVSGTMTSPETYEMNTGSPFTAGDTIQAAIGQSETFLTPLHLAVVAMTLANKGVRYRPYLVDSVWNYDYTELIYETEPEIVDTYAADKTEVYDIVTEGMIRVTDNVVWPLENMNMSHLAYLPGKLAIKTGTPQVTEKTYNSTVMGFYPVDDPQIAFGIVIENSEFSRYMIRNIIDAYFYDAYEPDINEAGLIATPWKRWSKEKAEKLVG